MYILIYHTTLTVVVYTYWR